MAFDAARYERDVLRALRGSHGKLPPGDIWARYAMEPGLGAAQIMEHLSTLRAFWRGRARVRDGVAEVCRLLIAADDELRKSAGDAMHDPAWWREQAAPAGSASRTEAPPSQTGPPPPRPRAARPPTQSPPLAGRWQAEARALIRTHLDRRPQRGVGEVDGHVPGVRVRPRRAPESGRASTLDDAETGDGLVGLTIDVVAAAGRRCRIRCSWHTVHHGQVRVRWSAEPPPWTSGTVIDEAEIDRFGAEFGRATGVSEGLTWAEAELEAGYHVYVPFLVSAGRATVGRFVGHSVAEPVRELRAEWSGDEASISWVWPADARQVDVEWTPAGGATDLRRISQTDYKEDSGLRLPAGLAGGVARVSAIRLVDDAEVISPAREVTLAPRPPRIGYELLRPAPRLRPRNVRVRLASEVDFSGLDLTVVAASGLVMPGTAADGVVLERSTGLSLTAGHAHHVEVTISREVYRDRPCWVRCFVDLDAAHVLVDPPVETLKVT